MFLQKRNKTRNLFFSQVFQWLSSKNGVLKNDRFFTPQTDGGTNGAILGTQRTQPSLA